MLPEFKEYLKYNSGHIETMMIKSSGEVMSDAQITIALSWREDAACQLL